MAKNILELAKDDEARKEATHEPIQERIIKQLLKEGFKLVSQVSDNGTEYLHFLNKSLEHIGIQITDWQDTEIIADLLGISMDDLPEDEEQAEEALMKEWEAL